MKKETGDLSIHTENIMPIIKKWLYSDHEIFLRELVSNAADAIQKLNHLAGLGEFKGDAGKNKIEVSVDPEKKTITVSDNGIGMTADEVKKYINQIAFSGAEEFLQTYKKDDQSSQIIGHFGLGFYSAYMVADLVEIHSLSHKDGANGIHWTCDGSTKYELEASKKKTIGTEIILHINDENKEFLTEAKLKELLNKYCSYYAVPIYLMETQNLSDEDKKKTKKAKKKAVQINDTKPIWTKKPSDLKDKDYLDFYHKEYPMNEDPLFWIHINVDFPFNLNGILFFPKLRNDWDQNKSEISLYCNQVFVTDQTQDLIPEFLLQLQGVIDSTDIPLNVSRSYLQKDSRVKKISGHITKKIADKLKGLFNTERKKFEGYWSDIHPFIKYGMLRDDEFYEKVKEIALFKTTADNYVTLDQYKERNTGNINADKKCVVLYTSDVKLQATYLNAVKNKKLEAVILDHIIDNHFIQMLESKMSDFKFKRIDSDSVDRLINSDSSSKEVDKAEKETFEKIFKEALKNDKLDVKVESMSDIQTSALVTQSEEQRRMKEMMRMMNPGGATMDDVFGSPTLVINSENEVIKRIKNLWELDKSKSTLLVEHVYDLACMSQKPLEGDRLDHFIKRSNEVLKSMN
ncbi:MAG: molecular chaperone HtpG [Calditrichaeota bacterium]|nr:molecular chaperone HtpG [Calditrichota bacterium]